MWEYTLYVFKLYLRDACTSEPEISGYLPYLSYELSAVPFLPYDHNHRALLSLGRVCACRLGLAKHTPKDNLSRTSGL